MMNCTTFAQRLGAAPDKPDEAMRAHMTDCAACSALYSELHQFDATLRAALDIDVPAGLGQLPADEAQQDERDNVVPLRRAAAEPHRGMNKPLFALAATVLLSVGVFFGSWMTRISTSLPQAVVAHIEHEPNLLVGEWSVVPVSQLNSVLTSGRVSLKGDIGTVRHAGLCSFRGNKVAHVVVQSSNGPVTVMLLPEEQTDGITSFDEDGYRGVLIPVGDGSIAVISDSDESTEEVRNNLTDKVAWSI